MRLFDNEILKMPIPLISTTKFNEATFNENMKYKSKHNMNINSCIYGTPIQIRDLYEYDNMYVVEMDNTTNKILGIGLINVHSNHLSYRKDKIYKNCAYNIYTYVGKHRISRKTLISYDYKLVAIFDVVLFKGKSNVKRIKGISVVSDKIFIRWGFDKNDIINRINAIFRHAYK